MPWCIWHFVWKFLGCVMELSGLSVTTWVHDRCYNRKKNIEILLAFRKDIATMLNTSKSIISSHLIRTCWPESKISFLNCFPNITVLLIHLLTHLFCYPGAALYNLSTKTEGGSWTLELPFLKTKQNKKSRNKTKQQQQNNNNNKVVY